MCDTFEATIFLVTPIFRLSKVVGSTSSGCQE
jgi:hypothetical protein